MHVSVPVTITLHPTFHRKYSHQWYDSMDPITALRGPQSVAFDPSHLNSGPEPAVLHVQLQTPPSQLPALSQTCDEASGFLPIDWTTCNENATAQSTIWPTSEISLSKWCMPQMHIARGQQIIMMTVIPGVQYPSIFTTIPFTPWRTTHMYADVTASYQHLPSHDMQNTYNIVPYTT